MVFDLVLKIKDVLVKRLESFAVKRFLKNNAPLLESLNFICTATYYHIGKEFKSITEDELINAWLTTKPSFYGHEDSFRIKCIDNMLTRRIKEVDGIIFDFELEGAIDNNQNLKEFAESLVKRNLEITEQYILNAKEQFILSSVITNLSEIQEGFKNSPFDDIDFQELNTERMVNSINGGGYTDVSSVLPGKLALQRLLEDFNDNFSKRDVDDYLWVMSQNLAEIASETRQIKSVDADKYFEKVGVIAESILLREKVSHVSQKKKNKVL